MPAGNHNLGTIRGTIEIDYDGAGIVRAIKDVDKSKNSMGGLEGASNKILGAFGKFASGSAKLAGGLNLVTNAAHFVVGAVAAIGPIAAAGLATLPGVILGGVAAMQIFKIATSGVGEALKAAGGDSKKFDEAIKNLSPQAQSFAKAFQKSLPILQNVKKAIQDAFFKDTAGQVKGVVKSIAGLKGPAVGVSSALGVAAKDIVSFVTSSKSINSIKTILRGVRDFITQAYLAIGPLIQGFLGLGAQAAKFGGVLGGDVNAALTKLSDFVSGINLQDLFAKALPILKQFGSLFSTIGSIVTSVFSGISVDGAGAVGILGALATQLAAFLKSASGKAALEAIGTALQAISAGAGQIFLALLKALAPAIVALAPGVTALAGQITGALVPAINFLNPILVALAGFISRNIGWLGPLAAAIVAAAGAYKVYSAAANAVSTVQDILKSKLVTTLAGWVASSASVVANTVAMTANAIATGTTAVAAWIANTAAIVANKIALAAGVVAMVAVKVATIAWTAVQWLLNAALDANPIGLVVLAIAALVAGIILAWQHSETFRNIVIATWNAIKAGAIALWHAVVNAFNAIVSGVRTALNAVASVAKAIWSGIVAVIRGYINIYKAIISAGFNAARAVISAVLTATRAVVRAVWSAIVAVIRGYINTIKATINGISAVVNTVKNAFNRAKAAAASALGGLVSTVRGLPGRVVGALGNLGGLLFSKGKSLVEGFIRGIGSMIGAVRDKASSIVHAVTDFLPGSPAKTGPLSGKGYVLLRARRFMDDFASGLNDGAQKPLAAISATVNPIARTVIPTASPARAAVSPGIQPTGVATGERVYKVAIGDKDFADIVVDAMTGAPIAVSKAAKEGDRQNQFAGSGRR
jgi:hypothetical protein